MPLSYSDIADVIREMDTSSLDELTFDFGDLHIEIRRRGALAMPESPHPEASQTSPPTLPTSAAITAVDPQPLAPGQVAVRSPMVGRFYSRPAPEQPPFVETGSIVGVDDPLCLVEVMKLFTTVYATCAGRIARIEVEDGAMVEYDQLLFVVDED